MVIICILLEFEHLDFCVEENQTSVKILNTGINGSKQKETSKFSRFLLKLKTLIL